jgi:hypothetical protein
MKRIVGLLTATLVVALFATNVRAQSSGSFNYSNAGGLTACVLNNTNGTISGGQTCPTNGTPLSSGGTACTTSANCPSAPGVSETCQGVVSCSALNPTCPGGLTCDTVNNVCENSGICAGSATASCIGHTDVGIKTSSGNGNVFVVRPSAVIGLLTDVTVSSKQTTASSSAFAGVDFSVSIPSQPAKASTLPTPNFPVTYDSRFIQISTNLFQGLQANCTASAGGCFITFNESTVSAHSFDWVLGPLSSGDYDVRATWTSSLADFGIASSLTCVGPVNLTIQQNKVFQPSATYQSTLSF